MAFGTRVKFEPIRELGFADISDDYSAVGTPTVDQDRILSFVNTTDVDLYVSFDGYTNHLRFPKSSFKLFDLSTNKIRDDGLFLAIGTQIYVKAVSTLPLAGNFWVEVMYGQGANF